MKQRILRLIVILLVANGVQAQYKGGSEDGTSFSAIVNQNQGPNIFKGGNNDGGASFSTILKQNQGADIFKGGNNDGGATELSINQNKLANIYLGGSNDGIGLSNTSLQNPEPKIYFGGSNDGIASLLAVGQNRGLNIYQGGGDDGTSSLNISAQNSLPKIYVGGINDGAASIIVLNQNRSNPLPITLLSFNGKWINNDADLSWEINKTAEISHFILERSIDGGILFENVSVITPDDKMSRQLYHYSDENAWNLPNDFLLYRLKLVSTTGKSTYSTIVKLNKDKAAPILSAYPNPTSGNITLNIQNVGDFSGYQYQLYSIDGKLLQKSFIQSSKSYFQLGRYTAGTYQLVVLKSGLPIQQFKIILIK